jgi:hypothetical protein
MKYCVASCLIGIVLFSNSTLSDENIEFRDDQSPLDIIHTRYQNGYYTENRIRATDATNQQHIRIKQLLFSRMSLLEAKQQLHADTSLHADIEKMLAYTENELYILGVKPTEHVKRILRVNDNDR